MTNNNSAKFAFFYMLSLVALVFMSLASGMIIFQLINKSFIDVFNQFRGRFSPDQLKFAISALIISTPIYYVVTAQIHKNLFSGALNKESGIRKWLTYFILLVSSIVMIGWLIAIINSFLDGELTIKFILKAIAAIIIAAAIFTFYLYDIKRDEVEGKKDKIIKIYFYASLVVILAIFISSLFIVESPRETRNRKLDNAILEKFNNIDQAVNQYYQNNNKLPSGLEELRDEFPYITNNDLEDPVTKERFSYNIKGEKKYELCATFRTSNNNDNNISDNYYKDRWPHGVGKQCLSQQSASKEITEPIRL